MNFKSHHRAEELLLSETAGEITRAESEWLHQHLDNCPACKDRSRQWQPVLQSLKAFQVQVSPELIRSTKQAVHNRAQELQDSRPGDLLFWSAAASSWIWILWSASWLWSILDRLGNSLRLPAWTWQMAFGFWWLLPAVAVAVVLSLHREQQRSAAESGIPFQSFQEEG